jgi:SM-20-related protein
MEKLISEIVESIYEKGYCVKNDFFSPQQILTITKQIEHLKSETRQASIGRQEQNQINTEIRKDKIVWIDELQEWFTLNFSLFVEQLCLGLNRRCYFGINAQEFMLAIYNKGDFYKKHRDAFHQNDARKISIIFYFNQNWQKEHGGELLLYPDNENAICVEPKAGRLVVFESQLEHEVLISHKERMSITGWLKRL